MDVHQNRTIIQYALPFLRRSCMGSFRYSNCSLEGLTKSTESLSLLFFEQYERLKSQHHYAFRAKPGMTTK